VAPKDFMVFCPHTMDGRCRKVNYGYQHSSKYLFFVCVQQKKEIYTGFIFG